MQGFRNGDGRRLGIVPATLVVPPELEASALHLVNTETKTGGGSKPWKGTAELIVTPVLDA
jgi:phage major head subunit gpT-like protein